MQTFEICRENKSLFVTKKPDNRLIMSNNYDSKVLLSTYDFQLGVLHDNNECLGLIKIEYDQSCGKYALLDIKSNKYYCSPIDKTDKSFIANRDRASLWEYFDLSETTEIIDIRLDLLMQNLIKFYDNDINSIRVEQNTLKLFWWQSKSGFKNFGDELGYYVVASLTNKKVVRSDIKDSHLLSIGSILQMAPKRDKAYRVWGSGVMHPVPKTINGLNLNPSLLRGPLTHSLFERKTILPYGDPGLLSSEIWERSRTPEMYDWGIIPHHSQENDAWVSRLLAKTPNSILISTKTNDMPEIMKKISSCKFIASSSLHGLIVADSYQIPNIWLYPQKIHAGGEWKFFDYFGGIRRNFVDKFDPNLIDDLNKIKFGSYDFHYFAGIDKICKDIVGSFPQELV